MSLTRCKWCGAKLDADGYCSRPCKRGALQKTIDELRKQVEAEKAAAEKAAEGGTEASDANTAASA